MESTNLLIILASAVTIILFWIIVGYRYFKGLLESISQKWKAINKFLRKRQDLLPLLVEVVRKNTSHQEEIVLNVIRARRDCVNLKFPSAKKIELEYALTREINRLVDLGKIFEDLSQDVVFLQVRGEIKLVEEKIESEVNKYNAVVRKYNRARNSILLFLISRFFGFKRANIFEFEL